MQALEARTGAGVETYVEHTAGSRRPEALLVYTRTVAGSGTLEKSQRCFAVRNEYTLEIAVMETPSQK